MAPPPEKKQKTEEKAEGKGEEKQEEAAPPAAPEPPKELEEDAPACKQPKHKEPVQFTVQDTTLNVMQASNTNVLMSLTDGGIGHLLAGARANVGLAKGRYIFEVKVVEHVNVIFDGSNHRVPRFTLRVGFATSSSNLFLGESPDSVGFEANGTFLYNRSRTKSTKSCQVTHGSVLSVLLNLDPSSPNSATISLFKDGVRVTQPQALPEALQGKPLFPLVSFKNVTTHVNFGPEPIAPLPFTCRMIQDAAKADVVAAKADAPADGKYEVVFPVGLPDEGTFDRLDQFLQKNTKFTELSERMILDWIEKSGIWRQKGYGRRGSNDKPEKHYGIRELDDDSIRRAIYNVAPLQPRNYVVMEVKGNLLQDDRKALLDKFRDPMYKKVADVVIGEPPADFKKVILQRVLEDKQKKSDKAFEHEKQEKLRKKIAEKKLKAAAKAKKKAELEAKKRLAAVKAKAEAAKKKAAAEKEAKAGEKKEEKEEEKKEEEEEKKEEEEEEEEEAEEEEPEEPEEAPPKVELSAEEKALSFRPTPLQDLAPIMLSSTFSKFSLPDKSEGFDEVRFEWSKGAKADEYLKQWVMNRKLNSRVEELRPSAWFHQRASQWQKAVTEWRQKQNEHRASLSKKVSDLETKKRNATMTATAAKTAVARLEAAAAKAEEAKNGDEKKEVDEEKKKKEEEKKKKEEELLASNKEKIETATKTEEEATAEIEAEKKAQEKMNADFAVLDIFGAGDVLDALGDGTGVPVFRDFRNEDWVLMNLVFELNLLVHAFVHDVADPERPGVHVNHLSFYFKKYFGKDLRPKDFGVETVSELVEIVGDKVLFLLPNEVMASQLDGEFESHAIFAKLAETARRHRLFRIDLGEDAALKLSAHAGQPQAQQPVMAGKGGSFGQRSSFGAIPFKAGKGNLSHPYSKGGKSGGKSGGKGGKGKGKRSGKA